MTQITCPNCGSSDIAVAKTWVMLGCAYGYEGEKKRAKTKVYHLRCKSCDHSFRKGRLLEIVNDDE